MSRRSVTNDRYRVDRSGKTPPPPALPPDVVARTSEKYVQAYSLITGREFVPERG